MTTKKTTKKASPRAKKAATKPAPEKPKEQVPTPAQIKGWRVEVKKLCAKVETYNINLDDLDKRVAQIEKAIPDPPPVIKNAEQCQRHQQHMRKLCHLRTQLTLIQTRCIQAKTLWGVIIKIAKTHLWRQPELASLKNDTQRGDVLRQVLGTLELRYARTGGLIDRASALIWTLKDNQRAVLGMIQAAGEERFLAQVGMER